MHRTFPKVEPERPIRVLHVTNFDSLGGAGIAAYRLHRGLRGLGVDSRIWVRRKGTDDPQVTEVGAGSAWKRLRVRGAGWMGVRLARGLGAAGGSLNVLPTGLHKLLNASDADVIHLHWIHNEMISIREIAKIEKPMVWTLHDMWPLCGTEHHPESSYWRETSGVSGQDMPTGINRRIFHMKQTAWKGLSWELIAPSRWMAEQARQSELFPGVPMHVIPNGLDLDVFRPREGRECRGRLNLPMDRKLVLFGAQDPADPNKGLDLLARALQSASPEFRASADVVVFGAPSGVDLPGLRTHWMGRISDEGVMAALYAAADVLVCPSRRENFPGVVAEAVACGLPCVAFRVGGIPDLIEDGRTGWLAEPYDTDGLARGLERAISCRPPQDRSAANRLDLRRTSESHMKVYAGHLGARDG